MKFTTNKVGRNIPDELHGRKLIPFTGAGKGPYLERKFAPKLRKMNPSDNKLVTTLKDAIKRGELIDGGTISFHHHFRNGDYLLNLVCHEIAKMGLKDIRLVPSSIQGIHKEILPYIEKGIITQISCGASGIIAEAISRGKMERILTIRSHGGRARSIESGDEVIDIAFIGAPTSDCYGNSNGVLGKYACGSLGYAYPDAQYANYVVAVTNELVPFPNNPISISQDLVDTVVHLDQPIGNPAGIVSTTLRVTRDPKNLKIAHDCIEIIKASGLLKDGFSFQSGAGGTALAATYFLRDYMKAKGIKGSFGMGGATEGLVRMLEDGLFDAILDVQTFDTYAVNSLLNNPKHIEIGASQYANPHTSGCAVNLLDTVILGGTEVDLNFNVNTSTESDGRIQWGMGGHQDTAEGAKLSIIAVPLLRGRLPIVVDEVISVNTPGECIDVIVTERGIAINPESQYYEVLSKSKNLNIKSIEELKSIAENLCGGKPRKPETTDNIVAIVEYRDGSVLDVIYQIKG
ncbi:MAG: citrate lyase subunit alpha [Candidatus Heimdallarchaeota archaeon]|nr:citrate lyase subunit alpha [Candidatus Heimdallarchaeota archaeon]